MCEWINWCYFLIETANCSPFMKQYYYISNVRDHGVKATYTTEKKRITFDKNQVIVKAGDPLSKPRRTP